MAGWIKIHRDIDKHWISQDLKKLGWWVYLLYKASYEDNKTLVGHRVIEVKRGQLVVSLSDLAERFEVTKPTVIKFLDLLEQEGMITRCVDRKITIITICNYDGYQSLKEQPVTDSYTNTFTDGLTIGYPTKEDKEDKEININNLNARTREERVFWEKDREVGFGEYVKANQMMAIGRLYSLDRAQVIRYIEAFLDKCQIRGYGHKDIGHFGTHLSNFIEKEMAKPSAVPAQPQQKKSKNILEMYG